MKKSLLLPLLILAFVRTAMAADPAVPMADLEPQPSQSPGTSSASAPPGASLDDFAFGAQTAPPTAPSPGAAGRDDEYRSAPQPTPLLEGF